MHAQFRKKMIRFVSFTTPLIIGGIILAALFFENIKKETFFMTPVETETDGSIENVRQISSQDNMIGSASSTVSIITYGDTECPYTKEFFFTMQSIMSEYGERGVTWVFRHFPNDSIHKLARVEAEASECAGLVGGRMKFWQYIQTIFERTQSHDSFNPEYLADIANELGISAKEFEQCRTSGLARSRVSLDADNAIRIGSKGTPTSVIVSPNGKMSKIDGLASYDKMKDLIDEALLSMQSQ